MTLGEPCPEPGDEEEACDGDGRGDPGVDRDDEKASGEHQRPEGVGLVFRVAVEGGAVERYF